MILLLRFLDMKTKERDPNEIFGGAPDPRIQKLKDEQEAKKRRIREGK